MSKTEVKVGVYDFGAESVSLWLRTGTGGRFISRGGRKADKCGRIWCGADNPWEEVVGALVHELVEFGYMRLDCRFVPSVDYARDHAGYQFVATHAQHSEACARAGIYLAACLPDLGKAWKKWQKEH